MTDAFKICALGILCVFISIVLKETKSTIGLTVKIACCIFVFGSSLYTLMPVFDFARSSLADGALSVYFPIVFKSLGVAYITALAADICRDCGENALASNIELAGKAQMIVISMPAVKEILILAGDIIA